MTGAHAEDSVSGVDQVQRAGGRSNLRPGPLDLTGDLFLIILDDATGKLRIHQRVAGYALAGATLVELWQYGHLGIGDSRVAILSRPLPTDPFLQKTLGRLMADPRQVGLAFWLECLAGTAVQETASRLDVTGWIRRVERRSLLGGRLARYPPVDRNAAFWRLGRLASQLARQPDGYDLVLHGLADAIGFSPTVLGMSSHPTTHQRVHALEGLGTGYPHLAELCDHVRVLAGKASMSLRS